MRYELVEAGQGCDERQVRDDLGEGGRAMGSTRLSLQGATTEVRGEGGEGATSRSQPAAAAAARRPAAASARPRLQLAPSADTDDAPSPPTSSPFSSQPALPVPPVTVSASRSAAAVEAGVESRCWSRKGAISPSRARALLAAARLAPAACSPSGRPSEAPGPFPERLELTEFKICSVSARLLRDGKQSYRHGRSSPALRSTMKVKVEACVPEA